MEGPADPKHKTQNIRTGTRMGLSHGIFSWDQAGAHVAGREVCLLEQDAASRLLETLRWLPLAHSSCEHASLREQLPYPTRRR